MAALPYMYFYPSDYQADTPHLTTEEHGAYFLLLMAYWQKGEPLPDNDQKLSRIVKATPEKWSELRKSLEEYFIIGDNLWVNPRIQRDLEHVKRVSEGKRKGGLAASEKRKRKASRYASKCGADALINNNNKRFKRLLKDCVVDNGDKPTVSGVGNQFFSSDSCKYAWLFNNKQAKLFMQGLSKSDYLSQSRQTRESLADEAAFAVFEGVFKETRPVEKAINAVLKSFNSGSWSTPKGFV